MAISTVLALPNGSGWISVTEKSIGLEGWTGIYYEAQAHANPGWVFDDFEIEYDVDDYFSDGTLRYHEHHVQGVPSQGGTTAGWQNGFEHSRFESPSYHNYTLTVCTVLRAYFRRGAVPPGPQPGNGWAIANISISPQHAANEGCAVSLDGQQIREGARGQFPGAESSTASAANLWVFRRWLCDGIDQGSNATIQVLGDLPFASPSNSHTFVAEFWPLDTGFIIEQDGKLMTDSTGVSLLYDGDRS